MKNPFPVQFINFLVLGEDRGPLVGSTRYTPPTPREDGGELVTRHPPVLAQSQAPAPAQSTALAQSAAPAQSTAPALAQSQAPAPAQSQEPAPEPVQTLRPDAVQDQGWGTEDGPLFVSSSKESVDDIREVRLC